jgi:hypothetical protein
LLQFDLLAAALWIRRAPSLSSLFLTLSRDPLSLFLFRTPKP